MFGMDSVGNAPIVRRPACLGSYAVLVHVQIMIWIAWAVYVVYMSACASMYALYLYNIFGMDSLDDAPIVHRPACLGSHAVLVPVQYLAWTA